MIVYIAGPITGVPDYKKRFDAAAARLTQCGHKVLNPAMLPQEMGDVKVYMSLCLPMVERADAVVMLPGWENSRGACREWGYARGLNKIIVDYVDFIRKGDGNG